METRQRPHPHFFRDLIYAIVLLQLVAAPLSAQHVSETDRSRLPGVQDDRPLEGIHVTGAWTITVRERDGAFVQHRELMNALLPFGATTLAEIIAGRWVPGVWTVVMEGGICLDDVSNSADCLLTEPADPISGNNVFHMLLTSVDDNDHVVLSGNIPIQQDGTIVAVETRLGVCGLSTTSPDECNSSNLSPVGFTRKVLDSSMSVETNQTVTVEVRLSFE